MQLQGIVEVTPDWSDESCRRLPMGTEWPGFGRGINGGFRFTERGRRVRGRFLAEGEGWTVPVGEQSVGWMGGRKKRRIS